MTLGSESHQKSTTVEHEEEEPGEARRTSARDESQPAGHNQTNWGSGELLGQVLASPNMAAAWKRVKSNKGSAGVDGRTVDATRELLKTQWAAIRQQLLDGTYRPSPVRRVAIPKPNGGTRELGIPTVTDRLIQQALLQVLQPLIDPTFSEHSHGFRPGRSAHGALRQARSYISEGRTIVVDVDLEKFFDRVHHDILMARLAKHIADKAVLRLIRRYLEAGIMANGVVIERAEGTPQGGPLSPLLANVMLDGVDKALERAGHKFVRYADDCNIYVQSERAGQRVLANLRRQYERLQLRVNEAKTAVGPVWGRKFLGYTFRSRKGEINFAMSREALERCRQRLRELTRRQGGRSMVQIAEELRKYLLGWKNYFQLIQNVRCWRELDEWLRHRLRAIQLKHWRSGPTIYRELRALGASDTIARQVAGNARRWWRNSAGSLNNVLNIRYFDSLGVPRLGEHRQR